MTVYFAGIEDDLPLTWWRLGIHEPGYSATHTRESMVSLRRDTWDEQDGDADEEVYMCR
jgi:hypothetical protein